MLYLMMYCQVPNMLIMVLAFETGDMFMLYIEEKMP